MSSTVLSLCLGWSNEFGYNVAVWWSDVCVIVLDSLCNLKPKFLIEFDGILIISLDMQVNLTDVLLSTEIKHMI